MAERDRLDKILHSQGYFPSRSKAKRAIMAGMVYVNGQQVDKAGTQVCTDDNFEVRGDENPFVSRGGLKLARALDVFSVDPEGQEVIDVGASTGGFTDCLLQAGASKVYAIDVGYGQLAWKIRQDERVEVIEKTNFRHLTPEELEVQVPLIVIDVSFISLRLIIPAALEFLTEGGEIIALIKPQFEAGKERVGNRGLVKDRKVHIDVLEELMSFFQQQKLTIAGLDFSPITGASSKNIEFLVHLKKMGTENNENNLDQQIRATVQAAHRKLEN
ncbi:MAG: TlyA family RNA methyltransferase [Bacillota bacterium]